jgi:hypothetical protein
MPLPLIRGRVAGMMRVQDVMNQRKKAGVGHCGL